MDERAEQPAPEGADAPRELGTEPGAPQPDGPGEGAARPPRRPRRWLGRLARALGVLVAVALGAAVVLAIWLATSFSSLARDVVLDEAARRGFRIEPGEVEARWGEVILRDTEVQIDGVPDLELSVTWIRIRAEGLVPIGVEARGVRARARTLDAAAQILAFGRGRADELLPMSAEKVGITLSRSADVGEPVLDVQAARGSLSPGEPARLTGALVTSRAPELRIGPIDLVAVARGATVELGVGPSLEGSPIRAFADLDARAAQLQVPRVAAPTLAELLGRRTASGASPWPGPFDVEAEVQLRWPRDPRGDVEGTAEATLFGLVPPHPAELSGIVFGTDTRVALRFRSNPAARAIALEALSVRVGSLALSGTGTVEPRGESFDARASLRGPIPCADLVGSAAVARLGLPLGAGLGALAQQGLAGSVDLRLEVRVRGERIDAPEVLPSASIHCRLRLFGG